MKRERMRHWAKEITGFTRDSIVRHNAIGDVQLTRRCLVTLREGHIEIIKDLIHCAK